MLWMVTSNESVYQVGYGLALHPHASVRTMITSQIIRCFSIHMVLSPIVVDCGGLPAPMDGTVKLTGTHFGDKASYFCNPGFILEGDSTRECETSGEWSGAEPVCKRK